MTIEIELANTQTQHPVDSARLIEAARGVLQGQGIQQGSLSIAVVEDSVIHDLNRRFLQHDNPTDVLSFLLDASPGRVEGEVVVSADTAAERCGSYGWAVQDELVLYVVHGVLHLVGFDDGTTTQRQAMQERETFYLGQLGLTPRYDEAEEDGGKVEHGEETGT